MASATARRAFANWVLRFANSSLFCEPLLSVGKLVGDLEVLQSPLRLGRLSLQFSQPVLKPLTDNLGRLELGIQRARNVGVGQRVGDLGCLIRILRLERDTDDVGNVLAKDGETLEQRLDGDPLADRIAVGAGSESQPKPSEAFL